MARGGADSPAFILWNHATSDKNSTPVTWAAKPAVFQTYPNLTRLFLAYITKGCGWNKQ